MIYAEFRLAGDVKWACTEYRDLAAFIDLFAANDRRCLTEVL